MHNNAKSSPESRPLRAMQSCSGAARKCGVCVCVPARRELAHVRAGARTQTVAVPPPRLKNDCSRTAREKPRPAGLISSGRDLLSPCTSQYLQRTLSLFQGHKCHCPPDRMWGSRTFIALRGLKCSSLVLSGNHLGGRVLIEKCSEGLLFAQKSVSIVKYSPQKV